MTTPMPPKDVKVDSVEYVLQLVKKEYRTVAAESIRILLTDIALQSRIDEMVKLDATKFNCEPEWIIHGYATDRIKELEAAQRGEK